MIKTNFEAFVGDDFVRTVSILDADGAAQDITGWKLFITIKTNPGDTDANAIYKNEYDPSAPASAGIFTVTIPNADTDDIAFGTYYYDMQIKKDDDTPLTILKGVFTFSQQLTVRTA